MLRRGAAGLSSSLQLRVTAVLVGLVLVLFGLFLLWDVRSGIATLEELQLAKAKSLATSGAAATSSLAGS